MSFKINRKELRNTMWLSEEIRNIYIVSINYCVLACKEQYEEMLMYSRG